MTETPTQAEIEALVEHAIAAMAEHESYIKEQGGVIISRGIMPECISALTSIHAENGILRTEKHADAEAIAALQAELDSAQTDLAKVILSLPTGKGERAAGAVEGVKMLRSRLEAELDAAITRAEEAEKSRDEWCDVSQKNYQLARDMEKRLIDILYS